MYSISVAFVGRCTIKKKLLIFLLRSVNNKTSQFVYLYLRIIIKIYRDCEKKIQTLRYLRLEMALVNY